MEAIREEASSMLNMLNMLSWRPHGLPVAFFAAAAMLQGVGCGDQGKAERHLNHSTKHGRTGKKQASNERGKLHRSALSAPESRVSEHSDVTTSALHGACTRADRDQHVHHGNQEFVDQIRECGTETRTVNRKNVACMSEAMPSLSNPCVQCFADMASCTFDHCKLACMVKSTGKKCIDCANSNCQAALVKCSGVARGDLP